MHSFWKFVSKWDSYGHSKSGKSKSAVASPDELYVTLASGHRSRGASEAWQAPWCAAIILKAVDSPPRSSSDLWFSPSDHPASALSCLSIKRERWTSQPYRDDLKLHHSEHMHTYQTQVTCYRTWTPKDPRTSALTKAVSLLDAMRNKFLTWCSLNIAQLSVLAFPARFCWEVELVDPPFEAM